MGKTILRTKILAILETQAPMKFLLYRIHKRNNHSNKFKTH